MTGNKNRNGLLSLINGTGWTVNASSGIISLTEKCVQQIMNPDPFENWYNIDQEPLARGQFAVVYHCCHKVTGVEYAAKFSSRWRFGTDCVQDILHEIAVCAMLELHKHAVQLIDVFNTATDIILVMEYAPGGDLQTLLDEELVPYEHDVVSFIRQLLEILVVIHDKNLVHLDIKPQNVVLMGDFPDCEVKLCDFEISRMLTKGHEIREILGTPDYVAPEILHYEPITVHTDMWSVGVLTYVLLTGFLPFGGENDQETFLEISQCELDFPSQLFEDITPAAIDFIKKLLIRQPEERMSAQDSLMHSWIRSNRKRPPSPNNLHLDNINSPALKIGTSNIAKIVHSGAERSLSCPLSDNSADSQGDKIAIDQSSLEDDTIVILTPLPTKRNILVSSFIQRSDIRASRQNLERIKSLSKSREVLSEKIQMSNLKKCQSKSREQIKEAKFSFSKSHEQLMVLRSLSQSVDALSVLSRLQQANNLCSSCNNIYTQESLDIKEEQRMYKSLASIDQMESDTKIIRKQYGSTVSLNTQIYNDILTKRNTDINCKLDVYYKNTNHCLKLNSNMYEVRKGVCEIKCAKNQKIMSDNVQGTHKSGGKRKDIKNKKDRKVHQTAVSITDKRNKSSSTSENEFMRHTLENSSSCFLRTFPTRRGSVSHVEQRLLKRHARQERKQRDKNSIRRKSTSDCEKRVPLERSKLNKSSHKALSQINKNMCQSIKRNKTDESAFSSDVSQASSLESVDDPISSPDVSPNRDVFVVPIVTVTEAFLPISCNVKENNKDTSLKGSSAIIPGYIINCNSNGSNSSNADIGKRAPYFKKQESLQEKSNISVSERVQNFEKVSNSPPSIKSVQFISNNTNHKKFNGSLRLGVISEEDTIWEKSESKVYLSRTVSSNSEIDGISSRNSDVGILTITNRQVQSFCSEKRNETDKVSIKNNKVDRLIGRNSSEKDKVNLKCYEVGSFNNASREFENYLVKSNSSYNSKDRDYSIKKFTDDNMNHVGKGRSRSFSVHPTACDTSNIIGRSRSNSLNYNSPIGMPWGYLCSGVIARAFEKFNFTETPSISPRNTSPTFMSPLRD